MCGSCFEKVFLNKFVGEIIKCSSIKICWLCCDFVWNEWIFFFICIMPSNEYDLVTFLTDKISWDNCVESSTAMTPFECGNVFYASVINENLKYHEKKNLVYPWIKKRINIKLWLERKMSAHGEVVKKLLLNMQWNKKVECSEKCLSIKCFCSIRFYFRWINNIATG